MPPSGAGWGACLWVAWRAAHTLCLSRHQACELLGIEDITNDLTEKVRKVGAEELRSPIDPKAAKNSKDALAKQIYNMLFDLLVSLMNQKIDTDKHSALLLCILVRNMCMSCACACVADRVLAIQCTGSA